MELPAPLAAAWRTAAPFIGGGLGGCLATLCVLPADSLKVQMQLQALNRGPKLGALPLLLHVVRTDGAGVLWSGLSAAWARQFVYTAARVGLYSSFTASAREAGGGGPLALAGKLACAAGAGGLAALLSTPLDLALTRIQAENGKPLEARAQLGGPGAVLRDIYRNEGGLRAVWRGATPTVVRAVVLNMGMLAVGDHLKEVLQPALPPWYALVLSSVLAGLCSAIVSLPADLLKTRLQSQSAAAPVYSGFLDCAVKTLRKEGVAAFWSGLGPYCSRIAPHAVITLISAPVFTKVLLMQ